MERMPIIQLDEATIGRIAAGEVVEGAEARRHAHPHGARQPREVVAVRRR